VRHAQTQAQTQIRVSEPEDTIDLKAILELIRSKWLLLLSALLLGGLVLFVISTFYLPKIYQSSIELYVNNTETKASGDVTQGDIQASKSLASTYIVVLKNPSILDEVSTSIKGQLNRQQLEKVLEMTNVDQTEVVRIVARTEDPALSAQICAAYAAIAPKTLERVIQAGSVEIIGDTFTESNPVSPNIPRNTLLGALGALVLCLIFVFIRSTLDNTVKSGFDLSQKIDIPVLGSIPSFKYSARKK
jgi:capsular polysaccharide biosynthesis protein